MNAISVVRGDGEGTGLLVLSGFTVDVLFNNVDVLDGVVLAKVIGVKVAVFVRVGVLLRKMKGVLVLVGTR